MPQGGEQGLDLLLPVPMGGPLTVEAAVQWTRRARGGFAHGLQFVMHGCDANHAARGKLDIMANSSDHRDDD